MITWRCRDCGTDSDTRRPSCDCGGVYIEPFDPSSNAFLFDSIDDRKTIWRCRDCGTDSDSRRPSCDCGSSHVEPFDQISDIFVLDLVEDRTLKAAIWVNILLGDFCSELKHTENEIASIRNAIALIAGDEANSTATFQAKRQQLVDREVTQLGTIRRQLTEEENNIAAKIARLSEDRIAEERAALARKEESWLRARLIRFPLADTNIEGVGDQFKARLRSRGIRTAGDIKAVQINDTESGPYSQETALFELSKGGRVYVPGIGPTKATAIKEWRDALIAQLSREMPHFSLSEEKMQQLAAKYDSERRALENAVPDLQALAVKDENWVRAEVQRRAAELDADYQRDQKRYATLRLEAEQALKVVQEKYNAQEQERAHIITIASIYRELLFFNYLTGLSSGSTTVSAEPSVAVPTPPPPIVVPAPRCDPHVTPVASGSTTVSAEPSVAVPTPPPPIVVPAPSRDLMDSVVRRPSPRVSRLRLVLNPTAIIIALTLACAYALFVFPRGKPGNTNVSSHELQPVFQVTALVARKIDVRAGPSFAFDLLGSRAVAQNETVQVFGSDFHDSWYKIRVNEVYGWIPATDLMADDSPMLPAPTEVIRTDLQRAIQTLLTEKGFKAIAASVTPQLGVILAGKVSNEKSAHAAVALARSVKGVTSVQNNISVVSPPRGSAGAAPPRQTRP